MFYKIFYVLYVEILIYRATLFLQSCGMGLNPRRGALTHSVKLSVPWEQSSSALSAKSYLHRAL